MVRKGSTAVRTAKPSEKKALAKVANAKAAPQAVAAAPVRPPQDEPKSRPIEEFPDLIDVLPALAIRSRELATAIKEAEEERKAIGKEIEGLLIAAEWNSIEGDTWCAVRARGSNVKLDPKLLLANGVSMSQIEDSTVTTNYYYVQVRNVTPK